MSRSQSAVVVALIVAATSLAGARQQGAARVEPAPVAVTRAVTARVTASTTISGNALDSSDRPLVNVVVRLRDARFGRIVATQYTDQSGIFTFTGLEPGSYIVEIQGNDDTILAASQLLNVNAGEIASTVVKLPFRVPPFAGMTATTPSAYALVLEAVATGITALVPTAPISPNQ